MAAPRRRYDGYGRPLPILTDAAHQSRLESELNRAQRAFILRLLEDEFAAMLVAGTYAEVTLTFVVKDGSLMRDVLTTRCQQHRRPGEESDDSR